MGSKGLGGMIASPFDIPQFTTWNVVYTAIGAAVFWGRNGKTKLKVYYLSHVLDLLEVPTGRWRNCAEFCIFIVLGCIVGIGIVKPGTGAQALTAGFAWTTFIAKRT
jgi:hypothetical protein